MRSLAHILSFLLPTESFRSCIVAIFLFILGAVFILGGLLLGILFFSFDPYDYSLEWTSPIIVGAFIGGFIWLVTAFTAPPLNWSPTPQSGVVSRVDAGLTAHSRVVMFEGSTNRYKCTEEFCLNRIAVGDEVTFYVGERGVWFVDNGISAMRDVKQIVE